MLFSFIFFLFFISLKVVNLKLFTFQPFASAYNRELQNNYGQKKKKIIRIYSIVQVKIYILDKNKVKKRSILSIHE